MSYLPQDPLVATTWPEAWGKDIAMAIRMISEKWARHFPKLPYYQLKKATTPSTDPNVPTGEAGMTLFDPVWGEHVPDDMATEWKQPHGDATAQAAEVEKFENAVEIHIRLQRESLKETLEKYGIDEVRDVIAFVPLSRLDAAGVVVKRGDYFTWDGDPYEVHEYDRVGYWKNSNVRIYMLMNCSHRRKGS